MNKPSLHARLALIALTVAVEVIAIALAAHGLATAAPPAAGVVVQPTAAAQSGARGATITYTLRMTNTGTAADTFTMTVAGNFWPTTTLVNGTATIVVPLAHNHGADLDVVVTIPVTATGHDVAVLTLRSKNDPSVMTTATLTTTTAEFSLYLPLILK